MCYHIAGSWLKPWWLYSIIKMHMDQPLQYESASYQQRQRQLFMALWNDERSCSLTPSLLQRERLACSLAAHWHTLKGNTPQLTPQMAGCCAMTGVVLHSIICPSRAVACKTPSPWSLFAMGIQFDYEDCVWNPVNGRAKVSKDNLLSR